MRAIKLLLIENRVVSNVASLSLGLLVLSMLLIGAVGIFAEAERLPTNHIVNLLIGGSLGGVMLLGLFAMVVSSWVVLQRRMDIADWGVFLLITWIIPYLGISLYLGIANISWHFQFKNNGTK